MRHNEQPNILRVMVITVVVFWSVVYIGLKMFGII